MTQSFIILNHSFTLSFAFCKLLSLKKRLLKFDQELSACSKKKIYGLRLRLPTHGSFFTSKILVNLFGSGSVPGDMIIIGNESTIVFSAINKLVSLF